MIRKSYDISVKKGVDYFGLRCGKITKGHNYVAFAHDFWGGDYERNIDEDLFVTFTLGYYHDDDAMESCFYYKRIEVVRPVTPIELMTGCIKFKGEILKLNNNNRCYKKVGDIAVG